MDNFCLVSCNPLWNTFPLIIDSLFLFIVKLFKLSLWFLLFFFILKEVWHYLYFQFDFRFINLNLLLLWNQNPFSGILLWSTLLYLPIFWMSGFVINFSLDKKWRFCGLCTLYTMFSPFFHAKLWFFFNVIFSISFDFVK